MGMLHQDLPAALALCDQRIAELRIKVAAITEHERFEEKHELLRKVDGYQKCKEILKETFS